MRILEMMLENEKVIQMIGASAITEATRSFLVHWDGDETLQTGSPIVMNPESLNEVMSDLRILEDAQGFDQASFEVRMQAFDIIKQYAERDLQAILNEHKQDYPGSFDQRGSLLLTKCSIMNSSLIADRATEVTPSDYGAMSHSGDAYRPASVFDLIQLNALADSCIYPFLVIGRKYPGSSDSVHLVAYHQLMTRMNQKNLIYAALMENSRISGSPTIEDANRFYEKFRGVLNLRDKSLQLRKLEVPANCT